MKLSDVCDVLLEDCRLRNLSGSALDNHKAVHGQLRDFATERGISDISDIDVAVLRAWRVSWKIKPATHELRLVRDAHKRNPLLAELYGSPPRGQRGREDPVQASKPIRGDLRPMGSSPLIIGP